MSNTELTYDTLGEIVQETVVGGCGCSACRAAREADGGVGSLRRDRVAQAMERLGPARVARAVAEQDQAVRTIGRRHRRSTQRSAASAAASTTMLGIAADTIGGQVFSSPTGENRLLSR